MLQHQTEFIYSRALAHPGSPGQKATKRVCVCVCVCVCCYAEAGVGTVHAGRRHTVVGRRSRDQGLGLDELLQASQRTQRTCAVSPLYRIGGSVAEWLACWTQAQKGPGSNRSRDAVG